MAFYLCWARYNNFSTIFMSHLLNSLFRTNFLIQVTDAPKTKVLFGDVDVEEDKCISRLVQKVNYEKEGTPLQNYDGFLVAVVSILQNIQGFE